LKDGERWELLQRAYNNMDDDIKKEFDDRFAAVL
uniref:Pyruvate dehydrogenase (Acetyl-transferring) E1 component subunit alpha n=1 Tax=Anisakis simplex TaxID=6269 RepID=A0A0M3KFL8_ANISI